MLLCSDLIVVKRDEFDINKYKLDFIYKMPDRIDESRLSYPLPTDLKKKVLCLKCNNLFDIKSIFEIKYQYYVLLQK